MSPGIQFIQRSGILVLHIPAKADDTAFRMVPDMIAEKLGMPGTPSLSGIVVDFSDAQDINDASWKKLAANLAQIPGRNRFYVVNAPASLQSLISASGGLAAEALPNTDAVFTKLGTQREAATTKVPAKAKTADDTALEKLMLTTFQHAAIKTFEVQCSTKFKASTPHLKSEGPRLIHDIAASMGMMSKTVSGSVALGFKESVFLKIMGKMLGETYTGITSEVEDGCGELLNIIFGQAKRELSEQGHQFGKTLPTIFVGQSLRVRQLTPSPAFVLPFESELGTVYVELGYRRT